MCLLCTIFTRLFRLRMIFATFCVNSTDYSSALLSGTVMHDLYHGIAPLPMQLVQLPCTDTQCPFLGCVICECKLCGVPNRAYSSSAPKVKRLVPFAASFHFIFSSLVYSTPLPSLHPHPGIMAPMEKGFNWSNIAVGES